MLQVDETWIKGKPLNIIVELLTAAILNHSHTQLKQSHLQLQAIHHVLVRLPCSLYTIDISKSLLAQYAARHIKFSVVHRNLASLIQHRIAAHVTKPGYISLETCGDNVYGADWVEETLGKVGALPCNVPCHNVSCHQHRK
jgi:hypothetical protein